MANYVLKHYGVKGMKWYERRYQNEDGSLTPAGKARYRERTGKYATSDNIGRAMANVLERNRRKASEDFFEDEDAGVKSSKSLRKAEKAIKKYDSGFGSRLFGRDSNGDITIDFDGNNMTSLELKGQNFLSTLLSGRSNNISGIDTGGYSESEVQFGRDVVKELFDSGFDGFSMYIDDEGLGNRRYDWDADWLDD